MSRTLLVVVFALSAACAAQQKAVAKNDAEMSTPGQAKPKGVMRCTMERDTGSNFAERVCVWDQGKDEPANSAIDDELIRAQQRAAQTQHTSGGAGGN